MPAGDRRSARPDGGAGRKLGSGAAGALSAALLAALLAGAAFAQDCSTDAVAFAAAASAGTPALLCIEAPGGALPVRVEIADTEAERERGLMGRQSLAPDTGMLFVYPDARRVAFWMHDTPLPLDMIFIGAGGRIVSIHADAVPFDETPIWSGAPARHVLELAGGEAARRGIKPGARVLPLD